MPQELLSQRSKAAVVKMWLALGQSDFSTMKRCIHADMYYEGVPAPDSGAVGLDEVMRRLVVAWLHLKRQVQTPHYIVADGNMVFLDHTKKWIFKSAQSAENRFATIYELKDGKMTIWGDFWDVKKFSRKFSY